MKFSFDAKGYRDNLAKDLIEKRKESKEEAKEFADKEKATKKYQIAKEIKKINFSIEKLERDYEIKIETFDVSEKIPENIKLYLDELRLWNIKKVTSEKKYGERPYADRNLIEEAENLIDDLTEGDFKNPEILNHVIGGFSYDRAPSYLRLEKRTTLSESSGNLETTSIPIEDAFDLNEHIGFGVEAELWFGAGGSHWLRRPENAVIIVDPKRQEFKSIIQRILYANERYQLGKRGGVEIKDFRHMDEVLNKITQNANGDKEGGILIEFEKGQASWKKIAKWVVDLYHGKVYKLTEISEKH